jgi:hypothetical protein
MQPLFQWKSNKHYIFCVCVWSLMHPAYNAHVSYCHLWPACLYNIFPLYLIKSTIFEVSVRKLCHLILSTNSVCNISHSKKKWARYDQKCTLVFTYPLFLSNFHERWIFFTDFQKIFQYQFPWKSMQWKPSCSMLTDGRTDRQTWWSWAF